jgi:acyl-CoA synthetase (AMP-forming)/AMP-acid ligase II
MIHRSPLPDVEIPDQALPTYVLYRARELGDKPALIDGPTGRVLTYAALEQGVRALAGGLVGLGFAKGDVLALMAPNLPEYAIVFHGVARAGGVITTINPTYTEREVHHQLLDSAATILVTIPLFLETALAAAAGTCRRVRGRSASSSGNRWRSRSRCPPTTSSPCRTPRAPPGCRRASC